MTPSEAYLAQLGQQAFLSLWSYPNVFTDEGKTAANGVGQELSDLLVVFGDDVIVFSDKHIAFKRDGDLSINWKRWYRRAIEKSARQLIGAKRWIERYPGRLFRDAKCTQPLPAPLPPRERMRIHLVAVTRGSFDACKAYFNESSEGSLRLNTGISGPEEPFTVGLVAPSEFIHVFDEVTLDRVFAELDTARDFLDYLRRREGFLTSETRVIVSAGEEQLLSLYLRSLDADGEHDFILPTAGSPPDLVMLDESFWPALIEDPGYQRKKEADRASYIWDELIEQFIEHGSTNAVEGLPALFGTDIEPAVRCMADEPRLRRRLLGECLHEFLRSVPKDKRRSRLVHSNSHPNRAYVFLAEPFLGDYASYADYRRFRTAHLGARCLVARLYAPQAVEIVGLAFDSPNSRQKGGSEDLFYTWEPQFTPEMRAAAEEAQAQFKIFQTSRMKVRQAHYDEFPPASTSEKPSENNR